MNRYLLYPLSLFLLFTLGCSKQEYKLKPISLANHRIESFREFPDGSQWYVVSLMYNYDKEYALVYKKDNSLKLFDRASNDLQRPFRMHDVKGKQEFILANSSNVNFGYFYLDTNDYLSGEPMQEMVSITHPYFVNYDRYSNQDLFAKNVSSNYYLYQWSGIEFVSEAYSIPSTSIRYASLDPDIGIWGGSNGSIYNYSNGQLKTYAAPASSGNLQNVHIGLYNTMYGRYNDQIIRIKQGGSCELMNTSAGTCPIPSSWLIDDLAGDDYGRLYFITDKKLYMYNTLNNSLTGIASFANDNIDIMAGYPYKNVYVLFSGALYQLQDNLMELKRIQLP